MCGIWNFPPRGRFGIEARACHQFCTRSDDVLVIMDTLWITRRYKERIAKQTNRVAEIDVFTAALQYVHAAGNDILAIRL